jgi:hypothetical protein
MSNLTDFFPSGGGGGLTPKFQEFNASGTFTPSQALIDAGGYIEVFLVGGGGSGADSPFGGGGGEVLQEKMYLTGTTGVTVTIAASVTTANGNTSSFLGSLAGGVDLTALGGRSDGIQLEMKGSSWGGHANSSGAASAGSGVSGYGAGGAVNTYATNKIGVYIGKANSGQGSRTGQASGSGYCLIKWYE